MLYTIHRFSVACVLTNITYDLVSSLRFLDKDLSCHPGIVEVIIMKDTNIGVLYGICKVLSRSNCTAIKFPIRTFLGSSRNEMVHNRITITYLKRVSNISGYRGWKEGNGSKLT